MTDITTACIRHPNVNVGLVRGRLLKREGSTVTIDWAGFKLTGMEVSIDMLIAEDAPLLSMAREQEADIMMDPESSKVNAPDWWNDVDEGYDRG
jgi:hypothetical protein